MVKLKWCPAHVRNTCLFLLRKALHMAWNQAKPIKRPFLAAFKQQLQTQTDPKQRPCVPAPLLQPRHQSGGLKILNGRIKRTDTWQNQSVAVIKIVVGTNRKRLMAKPLKGFLHGVEIAHAVIDQAELETQSNPTASAALRIQRYLEIVPDSVAFGTAPTTVSTFWPPLNTINVGMLRMPY